MAIGIHTIASNKVDGKYQFRLLAGDLIENIRDCNHP